MQRKKEGRRKVMRVVCKEEDSLWWCGGVSYNVCQSLGALMLLPKASDGIGNSVCRQAVIAEGNCLTEPSQSLKGKRFFVGRLHVDVVGGPAVFM